MLRSPDPRRSGRDVKVIDVLDGAARGVAAAFGSDPALEAEVREALAESYNGLGEYETSLAQARAAYDLRVKTGAPDSEPVLRAMKLLAVQYAAQDHGDKAQELLEQARKRLGARADSDDDLALDIMGTLADMLQKNNHPEQAEPILRRVVAARERNTDTDPDDLLYNINVLGSCLVAQNKLDEAEVYNRRFYELAKATFGPEHPSTFLALQNLAGLMVRLRQSAAAEPMLEEAVRIADKVMGHDHVDTGVIRMNLGKCLATLGRYDEADRVYAEGVAIIRGALGNVYLTERAMELRYELLMQRGRYAEAEPMIRARLAMRTERGVEGEEVQLEVLKDLVTTLLRRGACADAKGEAERAVALAETLYPAGDARIARVRAWYGDALVCLEKYGEAEPLLLACYAAQEHAPGVAGKDAPATAAVLAALYERMGKPKESKRWAKLAGE
jgi:tetratricopeptide (TPR) repeat protein